jgi:2-keto-3-deoxy-6-phosphogluconate aldolase
MRETIDIPIVVTIVSEMENFKSRIEAGASIFNVSGAQNTAKIVRRIRAEFPEVPIIATGGPTDETIREVIGAGANAITYTPPTTAQIFRDIMNKYRSTF